MTAAQAYRLVALYLIDPEHSLRWQQSGWCARHWLTALMRRCRWRWSLR